jgi:hypothetical protein
MAFTFLGADVGCWIDRGTNQIDGSQLNGSQRVSTGAQIQGASFTKMVKPCAKSLRRCKADADSMHLDELATYRIPPRRECQ